MSRYSTIFNALFLSLLIVVIGGGVTLVHCNRMQQTVVAQLSMAAISDDAGEPSSKAPCCMSCHEAESNKSAATCLAPQPCMDYEHIATSPQTYSPAPHYSFLPPMFALPAYMLQADNIVSEPVLQQELAADTPSHGPPRSYLRFIRVLRI